MCAPFVQRCTKYNVPRCRFPRQVVPGYKTSDTVNYVDIGRAQSFSGHRLHRRRRHLPPAGRHLSLHTHSMRQK
ncbi:unnamed protein product, partial [Nesidiocoris tenuis]